MSVRHDIAWVATKHRRRGPTKQQRLEVLKRDHCTCVICGRSPAVTHGLELEVDHIEPFSNGGTDELANYQVLCRDCNRGKGNRGDLNKTLAAELGALLDDINPQIRRQLGLGGRVSVVANQEDYVRLVRANDFHAPPLYAIEPSTNTIVGMGAARSLGLYTVRDNGGTKVHFYIAPKTSAQ